MNDRKTGNVIVPVRAQRFTNFIQSPNASYVCGWMDLLSAAQEKNAIRIPSAHNRASGFSERYCSIQYKDDTAMYFIFQGWNWDHGSFLIDTPDMDVALVVADGMVYYLGKRWSERYRRFDCVSPSHIVRDWDSEKLAVISNQDVLVVDQALSVKSILPSNQLQQLLGLHVNASAICHAHCKNL